MGKKKIDINAKKGVDVNRVMEAAGLLKDSVVDEQAKKIKILKKSLKMNEELAERYHLELEKLQEDYKSLAAHFDGLCAERDNLAACLKSAENALAYKDKVIERIKKKNAKRMSEKCDVIAVLNKEIVFQYKRREKAEKFVNTLGQAFDLLKKNVEDYEHSIGR
jgi:chromosome segregation ATPase